MEVTKIFVDYITAIIKSILFGILINLPLIMIFYAFKISDWIHSPPDELEFNDPKTLPPTQLIQDGENGNG